MTSAAIGRRVPVNRTAAPAVLAAALALVLGLAVAASGRMGLDLSAQLHRAQFAGDHPLTPVDLSWLGGNLAFGYSLWVPAVMALLGVQAVSVAAATLNAGFTVVLLQRLAPPRAALWIAGVTSAGLWTENVALGRVSFAAGATCGLAALCCLHTPWHKTGFAAAGALAFLAAAGSPIAGLFLGIVALALAASGLLGAAVVIAVGAIVGGASVSLLFTDSGEQPFSAADVRTASLLGLALVLIAVTRRGDRALRTRLVVGSGLSLVATVVFYLIDSPVGSNITRLPLFFAVPLAIVCFRRSVVGLLLLVATIFFTGQQLTHDRTAFRVHGDPSSRSAYYAPLLDELARRGNPTGRIEIADIVGHWDSYYVADHYPLARGWLQQTDVAVNHGVFYVPTMKSGVYQQWLADNAVQYVAVPDAPLLRNGRIERDLVATGLPYLHQVWTNEHWRLYVVTDPTSLVDAPARVISQSPAQIRLEIPAGTDVVVRVRWLSWLALRSSDRAGCIGEHTDHVRIHAVAGGSYVLTSTLGAGRNHC